MALRDFYQENTHLLARRDTSGRTGVRPCRVSRGLDNVCAIQDEVTQSQLTVTLCSVPMGEGKGDGGTNYYVLFHDEATGVALVMDPT